MRDRSFIIVIAALAMAALSSACSPAKRAASAPARLIVATYSALGAIVHELVGDMADVEVMIPNGLDVHEWEPSAKDIETLTKAKLVVENGLGLEGGMGKALDQARSAGVKFFTASNYITVRKVGSGEGIPSGDPDQALGADDPHLWTDPVAIKAIVGALAPELKKALGIDVSKRAADIETKLDALDKEIQTSVAALPVERRKLVTGHESLGYFAQRFGFKLVGAIVPSLTTQAESSAADFVALKKLIAENQVRVIFTEIGTSPRTVEALAKETGVQAVALHTHSVPDDGSYFTFERNLVDVIIGALKE
jgi:zinc/manganese transport system substrate-binding protein